jgi:hypothetical protein
MSALAILILAVVLSTQVPLAAPDSSNAAPEATPESTPSCVSSQTTSPVYAPPAYQIEPDGSVPSGIVAAAEGGWDSSGCNTNGTAFPQLTPNAVSGSKPVTVSFVGGLNPRNNNSCGQTVPSGSSSYSILLYSEARGASGAIGSCGSTAALTQSLEHEFGHLLDLADSTCPGYIMGPVAFPPQTGSIPPQPNTRSIQPGECALANHMNITPAEQAPPPPPPPPPPAQCPPTCICPPSCESGCNADGVCQDDPCETDPTLPECGGDGGGGGGGGCGDQPCDDGVINPLSPHSPPPAPSLLARTGSNWRLCRLW